MKSGKGEVEKQWEQAKFRLWMFGQIFVEIGRGFKRKDKILFRLMFLSVFIGLLILTFSDVWLAQRLHLWNLYPGDGWSFRLYAQACLWIPLLIFGIVTLKRKRGFAESLREIFDLVGLKNSIGSFPHFLSLEPITGGTMKLRLTNGGFPIHEWEKKKEKLEANMRVFIDEVKAVSEKGIVEVTFSHEPMPSKVMIENIKGFRDYQFLMGKDRNKSYVCDFSQSPHLLVAGETGGGKSVFLRQMITTLKLNQPEAEFHLVDLKGGVEFGFLGKVPGIEVISEVSHVANALRLIATNIDVRIRALRERNLNDIRQFFASDEFKRMTIGERASHTLGRRVFVVVDECAEIFLFGLGHDPEHTRNIRGYLSRITRLGRAVGLHVVLATQRPDKNAVDPQVKTNLTSTVCYRLHDLGASLSVLGTGRACDLPKISGRGILKMGGDELELQTPFLDFGESMRLMEQAFNISLDQTTEPNSPDKKTGNKDEKATGPDILE